jgi:hypothetical protein
MRDQEQRQPVNSAAGRILGMPKGEIVGKDDAQLLPPETARRLAEADSRVIATGESSRLRGGAAGGWPIPHVPLDEGQLGLFASRQLRGHYFDYYVG